jgi:glutaminase
VIPRPPHQSEPLHSALIQQVLDQLHRELLPCREGKPADYIPELAKAAPDNFAIVLATADGRVYAVGDGDTAFTIQSISKPFMYGLALRLLSPPFMRKKVGVEPSGDSFNAISLDPQSGIPRNPMINAGAIATAAQVWHHERDGAEATILAFFSALAGRPLSVNRAVYASERETGHRNRAISHLLRNAAVIEEEPEPGLDLYFRQCSIDVTCRDLAVMAATLACQGRNPLTQEQPLDAATTTKVLAVMGSCGMYDYAGQWLYDVGMPAKSGVGGGVLAVVPGRLGIAVFSPRLDPFGNSVRGIAACRRLSEVLGLHLFDRNPLGQSAVRSRYRGTERRSRCWRSQADAAWLDPRRGRIAIVQAQGVLDFAAMEQLLAELGSCAAGTAVIVLDLGQVVELPASEAALLGLQAEQHRNGETPLLLCRADHLGPPAALAAVPCFTSLDLALEAAEDHLLSLRPSSPNDSTDSPATSESLLDRLAPEHQAAIKALLKLRQYGPGEQVMVHLQASHHLFIVATGRFSLFLPIQRDGSHLASARMATFTSGMVFGDAGFLSGRPRLADVVADTDGSCWVLDRRDFDRLQLSTPAAAMALLSQIALDLGDKLALCGQQLTLAEHL